MRPRLVLILVPLCLLLMVCAGRAADKATDSATEGERLVRRIFTLFQGQHWSELDEVLAPGFQSIHQDGIRDRDEEMRYLMGRRLSSFSLADFKTTMNGPVMIVTYTATIQESVGDKRSSTAPSQRMSVFVNTHRGWRWVAHASLLPVTK